MYCWGPLCILWGASATIVHADTETSKADVPVKPASAGVDGSSGQQKAPTNDNHKIDKNELDSIARNNDNNDTAVNDAIDKYAQVKQEEVGNNALIRASGKEPTPQQILLIRVVIKLIVLHKSLIKMFTMLIRKHKRSVIIKTLILTQYLVEEQNTLQIKV